MCYYLLLSYIKYQTKYSYSFLELSWIFSETVFERISLIDPVRSLPKETFSPIKNFPLMEEASNWVDLLSCNHYNIYKVRAPDLQMALF